MCGRFGEDLRLYQTFSLHLCESGSTWLRQMEPLSHVEG
ncbi:MAG: hypothetical protein ACI87O_000299 [Planctomycetota bacterium]|jgi:hypothetical protein